MTEGSPTSVLERREVIYCGQCGMPPEYCEWGPDFETHCAPWLKKHHPDLFEKLAELREGNTPNVGISSKESQKPAKPDRPRTIGERLMAFYEKYQPDKIDSVPGLLEKYEGKEDKLFVALTKKYGPEPHDPYYSESSDEEDSDVGEEEMAELALAPGEKKKRRGAGAKKKDGKSETRVVVQKRAQNKKRILTVILGMETAPDVKLKDASKAFSKKFAGSSSVKDGIKGKEIIIQGDHMYDVAEMIVDKFAVPESCVFLDIDGDVVPLR